MATTKKKIVTQGSSDQFNEEIKSGVRDSAGKLINESTTAPQVAEVATIEAQEAVNPDFVDTTPTELPTGDSQEDQPLPQTTAPETMPEVVDDGDSTPEVKKLRAEQTFTGKEGDVAAGITDVTPKGETGVVTKLESEKGATDSVVNKEGLGVSFAEKDKKEEDVEIIKSNNQLIAEESGYAFDDNGDGSITLKPKNLDEAMDMYFKYGPNVPIDKNSMEAISASKGFEYISKYKGADSTTLLQGFKLNEIGVGGPTWERLIRINGGEPTAAMLEAQRLYQNDVKIVNVNNTKNMVGGLELETFKPTDEIAKLDEAYLKTVNGLFGEMGNNWTTFKEGNDKLRGLNSDMAQTAAKIDELNVEKRKVLRNVQKKFPNMPLGEQLQVADKQNQAIDDQLFVEQRNYNISASEYKFENELLKGEFEFKTKMTEKKMSFVESIYGTQRGEAIRIENIERADVNLRNQIRIAEKNKLDAIAAGDNAAARDYAYDLALAEEKAKINRQYGDKFKGFSTKGGIIKLNTVTGEETILGSGLTGDGDKTTITNIVTTTLPDGTKVKIGAEAEEGLQNIIGDGIKIDVQNVTRTQEDQYKLYGQGRTTEELAEDGVPTKYAAPDKDVVTWTTSSTHMKGGAVDVVVPKGEDAETYISSVEQKMNENGFFRPEGTKANGDLGHFEFTGVPLPEGQVRETITDKDGNIAKVVLGAIGVPISFERTIKSQIPATLLNSEMELKAANDTIIAMHNAGIAPEDASVMFQGFRIRNPENLPLGTQALKLSRRIDTPPEGFLGRLSSLVNTGDEDGIIGLIEGQGQQQILRTNPDAPLRADVKTRVERLNKVSNTITRLARDQGFDLKTGVFQDFVGNLKATDLAELQTNMELLNAEERVRLFGTSVTGTEGDVFDPLRLRLSDKVGTTIGKAKILKEEQLRDLNNARQFTLPTLTENQLLNDAAFRQIYNPRTATVEDINVLGGAGVQGTSTLGLPSFMDKYKSRKTKSNININKY